MRGVFLKYFGLVFFLVYTFQVKGQFTVDDTGDPGDDIPGNGVCATAGGVCTLRAAIEESNALIGPNTIDFFGLILGDQINIDSELLINDDSTFIDADMDGDGRPDIIIVGGNAGIVGFHVMSADNTIRGFNMLGFDAGGGTIALDDMGATGNLVVSNFIGTNFNGDAVAVQPNEFGIGIVNGASNNRIGDGTALGRNIISGNETGIFIPGSDDNQILGNYIGLNYDGDAPVGNTQNGILLQATSLTLIGDGINERNVISGNGEEGILITGGGNNRIYGNYIGTNAAGNIPIKNSFSGIRLDGGSNGNVVGNGTAGGRNVISGNSIDGISINSSGSNFILGNFIGLDDNGVNAIPNTRQGIQLENGAQNNQIGDGTMSGINVISGNGQHGIFFTGGTTQINVVEGNYIGTQFDGVSARGNGRDGIRIDTTSTIDSLIANTIAYNGENGIEVSGFPPAAIENSFFGNSIHNNTLLGIELINGGNLEAPAPVINGADAMGNITGTSNNGAPVQIFADTDDEGEIFLGAVSAAGANWSITINLADVPSNMVNYTAIQDDSDGNTSEFSAPFPIVFPNPLIVTNTSPDLVIGSIRNAASFANSNPGPDTITFDASIQDQSIVLDAPVFFTDDFTVIDGDITGNCLPNITISGANIAMPCTGFNNCGGLVFQSSHNAIKYLNIVEYDQVIWGNGLQLAGDSNLVIGNYIGINLAGTDAASTRNYYGIYNPLGGHNVIGGTTPCERNIISGNTFGASFQSDSNQVLGNYFGTDFNGTSVTNTGNDQAVQIANGGSYNTVGSTNPAGKNTIASDVGGATGIRVTNAASRENLIIGNYIGTDVNGTTNLGGGFNGVILLNSVKNQVGDGSAAGRNLITGWSWGIRIQSSDSNVIIGNYVGLDVTGQIPFPNTNVGIFLETGSDYTQVGDGTVGGRNIVAGNPTGISINSTGVSVLGNYIGTNVDGDMAVANTIGIAVAGGGLDAQIGDGTAGGRNIVSGNTNRGIQSWGTSTNVDGNYVGVQADGTTPMGNGLAGVNIDIRGLDMVRTNVIAYNGGNGVEIQGTAVDTLNYIFQNQINNNNGYGISTSNNANPRKNTFHFNSIYGNTAGGINQGTNSQEGVLSPKITVLQSDSVFGTSSPNAMIQVFTDSADQGQHFVDSTFADASGNWAIAIDTSSFPGGMAKISALQDSSLNTSAFSVSVPLSIIPPRLYWSDFSLSEIASSRRDGSNDEQFAITSNLNATGLAIDTSNHYLYWAEDDGEIYRAQLVDPVGTLENIISTGSLGIHSVAVDPINGHVFWADTSNNQIGRANLDGSSPNPGFIPTISPWDVEVDPINDMIHWTSGVDGKIKRDILSAPAGEVETFDATAEVRGLALDLTNQPAKVYWADVGNSLIGRANLDGSGSESLAVTFFGASVGGDLEIDPFDAHLYYTFGEASLIVRFDLTDFSDTTILTGASTHVTNPLFLALDLRAAGSAKPNITAGGPTTFCAGGSVVLSSTVGDSYQWLESGAPVGGASGQTYTVTTSGVYNVEVITAGISDTALFDVVVTANPLPIPTFTGGPSIVCVDSTGNTYTTQSGQSNYSWSVSAQGSITAGGGTGDDFVTVT